MLHVRRNSLLTGGWYAHCDAITCCRVRRGAGAAATRRWHTRLGPGLRGRVLGAHRAHRDKVPPHDARVRPQVRHGLLPVSPHDPDLERIRVRVPGAGVPPAPDSGEGRGETVLAR